MFSESVMQVESRTAKIEDVTDDLADKVDQVASMQKKTRDDVQEASNSQMQHLSAVEEGIKTCHSVVTAQGNLLLELQGKLRSYVIHIPHQ